MRLPRANKSIMIRLWPKIRIFVKGIHHCRGCNTILLCMRVEPFNQICWWLCGRIIIRCCCIELSIRGTSMYVVAFMTSIKYRPKWCRRNIYATISPSPYSSLLLFLGFRFHELFPWFRMKASSLLQWPSLSFQFIPPSMQVVDTTNIPQLLECEWPIDTITSGPPNACLLPLLAWSTNEAWHRQYDIWYNQDCQCDAYFFFAQEVEFILWRELTISGIEDECLDHIWNFCDVIMKISVAEAEDGSKVDHL